MGKLRDEFTVNNLCLNHSDCNDFSYGQCKNPAWLVAWRLFWALYHSCWLVTGLVLTSLDEDLCLAKWFIYLSNWVYVILTAHSWMECLVVLKERRSKTAPPTADARPLPWVVRVTWCLCTIATVASVMVTLWYWTWIGKGKAVTALRLHFHGVNALYALANLFLTSTPFRLLHVVYPVTLGVLYTAFTAIYYALGGTNQLREPYVYKLVDWSRPGRTFALSSLSNFVFIPVVHVTLWLLYLAVRYVSGKMDTHHHRIESAPDSESEDHFNSV